MILLNQSLKVTYFNDFRRYKAFAFVVTLFGLISCTESHMSLALENHTITLGQPAFFKCDLTSENCTSSIIWYGGNGHKFLCKNQLCKSPAKYKEMSIGQCISMLKINDVNRYDITSSVTCQYAFEQTRVQFVPFAKSQTNILVLPSAKDIQIFLTQNEYSITFAVLLSGMYPEPLCEIPLKNSVISLNVAQNGMLYDAYINATQKVDSFTGCSIKVVCMFQNRNATVLDQKLEDLSDLCETGRLPADERRVVAIVICIAIVVMFCCTFFLLCHLREALKDILKLVLSSSNRIKTTTEEIPTSENKQLIDISAQDLKDKSTEC